MIAKYIGGIIGLAKDALRLLAFLLKRPHYVAVLLVLIVGVFYINGVPPREISGFLSEKWRMFVENRKQTFKEDYQLLSKHFADKKKHKEMPEEVKELLEQESPDLLSSALPDVPSLEKAAPVRNKPSPEEVQQQMTEETFGWQQAFREAKEEQKDLSDENAIEGVLTVVSADKVRIDGKTYTLNVRLLAGKAGLAYQKMKRLFDGMYAQCFPDNNASEKIECIVGSQSIAETLTDLNLAESL